MGKLFCCIGILSSLIAGEGAYRLYEVASSVADKALPLHMFVLASSAFGIVVFCLLAAGKSNAFLSALSAAMLLFSALVLLVAPVLDIAAYGVPGSACLRASSACSLRRRRSAERTYPLPNAPRNRMIANGLNWKDAPP